MKIKGTEMIVKKALETWLEIKKYRKEREDYLRATAKFLLLTSKTKIYER